MKLNAYTVEAIQSCLIKTLHPARIIVFGSYARGDASDTSDIDICAITHDTGQAVREAAVNARIALRHALSADGPAVDLLLCSADQFVKQKADPASIYCAVATEGETIYENDRQ